MSGVLLSALWSVLAQHGFVLTSPTIPRNGTIPAAHTCDGANVSPALNWFAAPAATRSYTVVLADNDVASGTVIHWIAYDLPPTLTASWINIIWGNWPCGRSKHTSSPGQALYLSRVN